MATVIEQAMGLSVEEKLHLISALWDSMTDNPEKVPVPAWQLEELERRIKSQRSDPQPGQSWEAVKRGILKG